MLLFFPQPSHASLFFLLFLFCPQPSHAILFLLLLLFCPQSSHAILVFLMLLFSPQPSHFIWVFLLLIFCPQPSHTVLVFLLLLFYSTAISCYPSLVTAPNLSTAIPYYLSHALQNNCLPFYFLGFRHAWLSPEIPIYLLFWMSLVLFGICSTTLFWAVKKLSYSLVQWSV